MVQFIVGLVFGVAVLFVLSMGAVIAKEERWEDHWHHPPDDGDGCTVDHDKTRSDENERT